MEAHLPTLMTSTPYKATQDHCISSKGGGTPSGSTDEGASMHHVTFAKEEKPPTHELSNQPSLSLADRRKYTPVSLCCAGAEEADEKVEKKPPNKATARLGRSQTLNYVVRDSDKLLIPNLEERRASCGESSSTQLAVKLMIRQRTADFESKRLPPKNVPTLAEPSSPLAARRFRSARLGSTM